MYGYSRKICFREDVVGGAVGQYSLALLNCTSDDGIGYWACPEDRAAADAGLFVVEEADS